MALVWVVLFVIPYYAIGGVAAAATEKSDSRGPRLANMKDSLFLDREKVLSVEYSSVGLTYEPNALGPSSYWWPSPVALSLEHGVWAVDAGEDRASWRLIHLNLQGGHVFTRSLVEQLELNTPKEFVPSTIHIGAEEMLWLLASRRYNSEGRRREDYVVAQFSVEGDLIAVRELPEGFELYGEVFITDSGEVINWERDGPSAAWYRYESASKRTLWVETIPGLRSVEIGRGILERRNEETFRLLSTDDEVVSVPLKNGTSENEQHVGGEGNFFGYLTRGSSYMESGDLVKKDREIHLMYYDSRRQVAYSLGEASLAPTQSSRPHFIHFTVYFPEQALFDEAGNFYDIAWSSSELTVYRYPLNREYVDERLRELREE